MNTTNLISRQLVPEAERMAFVDKLFGLSYVLKLEPTVFRFAEQLATEYSGGYWQFFLLSNGGFYMAPRNGPEATRSDTIFDVACDNGFEGKLSADALGIVTCLYAFSNLSFGDGNASNGTTSKGTFAEACADHYHLLRKYMFGHVEVRSILAAID
jgi:hypothetical protein